MPWKFVDEKEPPKLAELLVWNGQHVSLAKFKGQRFVAQAEGMDVLDPWERPVVVKGCHPLGHATFAKMTGKFSVPAQAGTNGLPAILTMGDREMRHVTQAHRRRMPR